MPNDEHAITVTRIINATPERIWQALTQPEQVAEWWGPSGFKNTIKEMDVRPGGSWTFIMHGPDGKDYPNELTYEEVIENERLSYLHQENTEYGLAAWHAELTLEKVGDSQTKVTLVNRFASEEEKTKHIEIMHAVEGANQTLERLAAQAENA